MYLLESEQLILCTGTVAVVSFVLSTNIRTPRSTRWGEVMLFID